MPGGNKANFKFHPRYRKLAEPCVWLHMKCEPSSFQHNEISHQNGINWRLISAAPFICRNLQTIKLSPCRQVERAPFSLMLMRFAAHPLQRLGLWFSSSDWVKNSLQAQPGPGRLWGHRGLGCHLSLKPSETLESLVSLNVRKMGMVVLPASCWMDWMRKCHSVPRTVLCMAAIHSVVVFPLADSLGLPRCQAYLRIRKIRKKQAMTFRLVSRTQASNSSKQSFSGPFNCYSHAFQETNSLRRTMQIVECSLSHWRAQGRVSS